MRSAILNVTFDCKDAALQTRFWSGVAPEEGAQNGEVARLEALGAIARRAMTRSWVPGAAR